LITDIPLYTNALFDFKAKDLKVFKVKTDFDGLDAYFNEKKKHTYAEIKLPKFEDLELRGYLEFNLLGGLIYTTNYPLKISLKGLDF
jgi:hypothetical protein